MRKRVSEHAKQRCKERFGVSNKVIKNIMTSGYTTVDYEGRFRDFLESVKHKYGSKGVTVKVKYDVIVIYNKRSQRAITCYRVPDKYIPSDNYLIGALKKKTAVENVDVDVVRNIVNELWEYLNSTNRF